MTRTFLPREFRDASKTPGQRLWNGNLALVFGIIPQDRLSAYTKTWDLRNKLVEQLLAPGGSGSLQLHGPPNKNDKHYEHQAIRRDPRIHSVLALMVLLLYLPCP